MDDAIKSKAVEREWSGEAGHDLDPRMALDYARRMKAYCEAFDDRDWANVMLHGSPDEQNLAHALDNLTECAAMLMNMAGRLSAASVQGAEAVWKDAVLDKLAVTCMDAPIGTPPAEILDTIIRWHVDVALDPAVSRKAQDLIDQGAASVQGLEAPTKLWLWKNFVGGRPEYWAFDNAYPIHLTDGDPQTLGEPCGYAIFKPSRNDRPDVPDETVLKRIAGVSEGQKP